MHLTANMSGDPSPIHGQGWQRPWQIQHRTPSEATLRFVHMADQWPWDYEARQHFRLDAGGLTATLTCRNLSDAPMPCGLGFHPYFPCLGDARLAAQVESVWTVDEAVLPIERIAVSDHYRLDGRPVCARGLDNGYGGWSGIAEIEQPGARMTLHLSSPEARYFQLYSPAEGGIFVAEPVSHANDALTQPPASWKDHGIQILATGEEMTLTMRLDILRTT